jgi:hypothetical protein
MGLKAEDQRRKLDESLDACPWYAVVEDPGPHVAAFAN